MNLILFKKYYLKRHLDPFEEIQSKYIETIIRDNFLKVLCNPEKNLDNLINEIHDLERFYMGFKDNPSLYEKLAMLNYVLNRFFIASSGPRFGKMSEEIMIRLLKEAGFEVLSNYNIYEFPLFKPYVRGTHRERKDIDFIARREGELYLIEQRISEHTGGRTAQESLFDKFRVVLDWIIQDPNPIINSKINNIHLVIAILYSENHKLLTRSNMSKGRFNSLVKYTLEPDNLGSRFDKLKQKGFKTNCVNFETCLTQGKSLEFINDNLNLKISYSILIGEEFFQTILNKGGLTVYKEISSKAGDDLWTIFSVMPYEIRLYLTEGKMMSKSIYDVIRNKMDSLIGSTVDETIENIAKFVLNNMKELRILEINDIIKQYEYLKILSAVALLMYVLGCPSS